LKRAHGEEKIIIINARRELARRSEAEKTALE
jgi:hypothetical protein